MDGPRPKRIESWGVDGEGGPLREKGAERQDLLGVGVGRTGNGWCLTGVGLWSPSELQEGA